MYSTLVYPDTNYVFLIQTSQAHSPFLFFTSLGEKKGRERVVVWLVSFRCEMYQENGRYCIDGRLWKIEETQFMPELSRFLKDKGGWEAPSAVSEKGEEGDPHSPFSLVLCF